MPDIDMDFCERRRGEVITYVRGKYGEDKVAQIATFSTLRARAAVRDTCRACAAPDTLADKLCGLLADFQRSHEHGRTGIITLALERHEPLRELYHQDSTAKRVLDLAARIEDLPRNLSTHAAGVVIAPVPLRTILPLTRGTDGEVMTQFDMHAVDRVGLLKMDFLGLTTLTIVSDTLEVIRQMTGTAPDLHALPLDDEPTFALLRQGSLLGIFQLETSAGMRRLVQDMRMSDFNDLIAVLALYRPGAMHASASYVARKLGREPVSYPHPKLEPILKDTFGIFLYQEQVMQCLHALAGYTLAEADIFRQIMSKKLVEQIEKEHGKFVKRAVEKEIDHDLAERLFDDIAKFANYGFNKSHATAYAFVAYWTAYLKANHPAAFFASMLNCKADTPEKLLECHQDCRTLGITLRVPDVNASATSFTVELDAAAGTEAIRFGLEAIRNVGPAAAEEIVRERTAHGPFTSIDNLCRRINHRLVNRKALDSLVKAGACDSLGMPRQRMCLIVDDATATWERSAESALQR
jgi:DNA polymerase-3 subunit alpha